MQYVLPVLLAMFQLCGCDVFTSDFKRLNIFSKSWLWPLYYVFNQHSCVGYVKWMRWGGGVTTDVIEHSLLVKMGKVVSSYLVALLCQGVVLNAFQTFSPDSICKVTFYSKFLLGDGCIGKGQFPSLPSIHPYRNIRYCNIYMEWGPFHVTIQWT